MENIFKTTRLQRGITQREVANLADMSAQAVMRYEQGLYENPSDKLVNVTCEILDDSLDHVQVSRMYQEFREHTQREASRYLVNAPPIYFSEKLHPFRCFREGITYAAVGRKSRIAFCILLAVHPATVAQYDEGRVKYMPALIHRALINGGLSDDYLKSLCELGEIWYERYSA